MDFKRNILITGGAGFIGSHVVRLFVTKYPEYHIINLDKLTYAGNLANLADIEQQSNYTFVKADICDFEKILELFRRYGYEYEFRTSHVADVFHVKNSRANLVIRELTAAGILESPSYGTYHFIAKN